MPSHGTCPPLRIFVSTLYALSPFSRSTNTSMTRRLPGVALLTVQIPSIAHTGGLFNRRRSLHRAKEPCVSTPHPHPTSVVVCLLDVVVAHSNQTHTHTRTHTLSRSNELHTSINIIIVFRASTKQPSPSHVNPDAHAAHTIATNTHIPSVRAGSFLFGGISMVPPGLRRRTTHDIILYNIRYT